MLIIFGRGIEKGSEEVSRARESTLTFFVMYLSPLKPKSLEGHNSHTVRDR